jgi:hypothetical protein
MLDGLGRSQTDGTRTPDSSQVWTESLKMRQDEDKKERMMNDEVGIPALPKPSKDLRWSTECTNHPF